MIPVRLQLKNFMSYGDAVPPLELAGVRLACLSGDNGNGKTAILDAMTWALFDECRAKGKDDVIRLGANDCGVLFDFLVDGVPYRINRKISRKSSGSAWELQVRREDNSYHPLSGTNQRETQEKIKALLRMDYDTFLATAYLAQGRADEFARATPNKRKEVLADILDLGRYDRLEEMAKEQEKTAKLREEDVSRSLSAIEAVLASRDRYEIALEGAERRKAEAVLDRDAAQEERHAAAVAVEQLDVKEQRLRQREEGIADFEGRNAEDARTITDLLPKIAQAQALAARKSEIEAANARLETLRALIETLEETYNRAVRLGGECRDLERIIHAEEARLDNERYQRQCQVEEFERDVRTLQDNDAERTRLQAQYDSLGDADAALAAIEQTRLTLDDKMAELKDQNAAAKHIDAVMKVRIDALSASDAAQCEYCGSPLPAAKRAGAVAEAQAERDAARASAAAVAQAAAAIKAEMTALKADADGWNRTARQKSDCQSRIQLFDQTMMRLSERVKQLPKFAAERDALAKRLQERDFAHAEQERLAGLSRERERAEAAYAPLEGARRERELLRNAPRERDHLSHAEALLETEPARVAQLQETIAGRTEKINKAKAQVIAYRAELADLAPLRRMLAELDAKLAQITETLSRADREIGSLQGQLEHCRKQVEEKQVYAAELADLGRRKDLYRELAGAFGKKGVQALIIENALPEIVSHANELLNKLSNGAMQVELRTTRPKAAKGAGDIETLDIIISDEMGTRPYEMFSGGEAFRVNFALRVALSRVLASRAGAPLQTLIVDEGFGTQDPRGREAITEALQNIQEYFALILCITHIEEIKEAFPTRIEVTKGANGSTFTVS